MIASRLRRFGRKFRLAKPFALTLAAWASVGLLNSMFVPVANARDGGASRSSFRPDRLKRPPTGKPNEVLVLGTMHLAGLPNTFQPEMLTPLLERLAGWRPTAIATEQTSGVRCDTLRRYPSQFEGTVKRYCYDPALAGRAAGLDVPAANMEVERSLAGLPAAPASAQRRRLALLFLAAGEPGSALVQWLRLPTDQRRAGDGLTEELAGQLDKIQTQHNETSLISAPLAARLGLERLWSVDDQGIGGYEPADEKAYAAALMRAWDNPAGRARKAQDERLVAALSQPGGILAMYRAYNAPSAAMLVYKSDVGAALGDRSVEGYGRGYVSYWETRNLRMVANIREVLGRRPGTRMLAIVGASHKGYYEAYLNQMLDVEVVNSDIVLR